jgi:cytidyltransferase-like protein
MKKKAIIVSGYFNPLHKGHIEYFKYAREKGDLLFVIVNNDYQRNLKGSKEFMLEDERVIIIKELKIVDRVLLSLDTNKSVCKSIEKIHNQFNTIYELIFANGGDQTSNNIPEADICNKLNIKMIDGLGDKIQSSSWILSKKNEN